jgi:hypothetical protein
MFKSLRLQQDERNPRIARLVLSGMAVGPALRPAQAPCACLANAR